VKIDIRSQTLSNYDMERIFSLIISQYPNFIVYKLIFYISAICVAVNDFNQSLALLLVKAYIKKCATSNVDN